MHQLHDNSRHPPPPYFLTIIPLIVVIVLAIPRPTLCTLQIESICTSNMVRPNRIVDRTIFVHCTFSNPRSSETRVYFVLIYFIGNNCTVNCLLSSKLLSQLLLKIIVSMRRLNPWLYTNLILVYLDISVDRVDVFEYWYLTQWIRRIGDIWYYCLWNIKQLMFKITQIFGIQHFVVPEYWYLIIQALEYR